MPKTACDIYKCVAQGCGAMGAALPCKKCRTVYYCSKKCRKASVDMHAIICALILRQPLGGPEVPMTKDDAITMQSMPCPATYYVWNEGARGVVDVAGAKCPESWLVEAKGVKPTATVIYCEWKDVLPRIITLCVRAAVTNGAGMDRATRLSCLRLDNPMSLDKSAITYLHTGARICVGSKGCRWPADEAGATSTEYWHYGNGEPDCRAKDRTRHLSTLRDKVAAGGVSLAVAVACND